MKKNLLLMIACFTAPLAAQAGSSVGNGGDVLVSQTGAVQLVDFYEAQTLRGMKIDLGAPSIAPTDKAAAALRPLQKLSPARFALYKSRLDSFFSDALLLPQAQLQTIDDVHLVAIPDGWTMVQIAVQKEPEFPEDKVYTINKDLWDKLDNDGQAGLMLHEIVYRETKAWADNSITARYFATSLAAHKFDAMSLVDFVAFLENTVQFHSIDVAGVMYDLTISLPPCQGLQLYPTGSVQCGFVTSGSVSMRGANAPIAIVDGVSFNPDGSLLMATLAHDTAFTLGATSLAVPAISQLNWGTGALNLVTQPVSGAPGVLRVDGPAVHLSVDTSNFAATLQFFPNGGLSSIQQVGVYPRSPIGTVTNAGQTLSVDAPLFMNADGSVYSAAVVSGTEFNGKDGVIQMTSDGTVGFGSDHFVTSCQRCKGTFQMGGQPVEIDSNDAINTFPLTLYPSGLPQSGVTSGVVIQGASVSTAGNTMTSFNEQGLPVSLTLDSEGASLKVGAIGVAFVGALSLYDEGNTIKSGTLRDNTELMLVSGVKKTFFANATLNFDRQGRVIEP